MAETCKCECRLDASVSNNKQCWNNDKCRCECQKLTDKGIIWNPSNCECECNLFSFLLKKKIY